VNLLDRYLARQILIGMGIAVAILLPLFSFLDLLEELEDVGEGSYGLADALRYVSLMVPRRLLQLAPFVTLLGNVIAFGRLATTLELTAMRAAGCSPLRLARAPVSLGLGVILLMAVLEQFVAPALQQQALVLRSAALARSVELGAGLGIWTRDSTRVLRIGSMGARGEPRDLEIMTFGADGWLVEHLRSPGADVAARDRWLLKQVTRKRIAGDRVVTERLPSLDWQSFLTPDQIETLSRPPESLSPTQLRELVTYLRATGQEYAAYDLALWRKLGAAFMLLAMVLLSVPFAFGSARTGLGHRLVLAAVIGIGVYLFDQIVANAGLLLDLSPPWVALGPGIVLMLLGQQLLVRAR
jgi:lipopolysaccharide export system permease protein